MSTDQLLVEIGERGLLLVRLADGRPALRGDPRQATPALLKAITWHRARLCARLDPPVAAQLPTVLSTEQGCSVERANPLVREWLWQTGHRYEEVEQGEPHPAGAWWWRFRGESAWRLVPDRNCRSGRCRVPFQEEWQEQAAQDLRDQVTALLHDLERRWQVPPVAFCAELARQLVSAVVREPSVVHAISRQIGLAVAAVLARERLEALGVRFRIVEGRLRAGPPKVLTPEVRETILRHKEQFLLLLANEV